MSVSNCKSAYVFLQSALLLVLLLLATSRATPQVTTGEVLGTVTDTSRAVAPGAVITVKSLSTAAEYRAISDTAGNYLVRLLPPGRYSMEVALPGFKTWRVDEVMLAASDRLRQDVVLETGQLTQRIEVTAQTPALQTDSAALGGLLGDRAVADLPLNGRNIVGLAWLVVGANDIVPADKGVDDRRRTSAVNVNGQSSTYNNFLIDGMDDNERFVGTIIVRPSIDALQEVKIQTSQYSAELGRTSAGVINMITKSGGNQFHGTLFEFFRNEKLDARNLFANPQQPRPAFKQNQFGGSVGGPIRKNRTFFFADYENFRLRQGQTVVLTVPTAANRIGDFSANKTIFDPTTQRTDPQTGAVIRDPFPNNMIPSRLLDPVALNVLSLYPLPQTNSLISNWTASPAMLQNDQTGDGRIDHRFSDSTSIFGRYSINDVYTFLPAGASGGGSIAGSTGLPQVTQGIGKGIEPGQQQIGIQRAQAAQASLVHIFGPRMTAELKGNYSRYVMKSISPNYGTNASAQIGLQGINTDPDASGLANFVLGPYAGLGDGTYLPSIDKANLYQVAGTVAYISGSHSVKAGADVRRRQVNEFQSPTPDASFTFDTNFTNDPTGKTVNAGNEIASLLLGYPASVTRQKYLIRPGYRLIESAAFVQDDWRASHSLTLNLGLRYEYFSPVSEVDNRISNIDLATGTVVFPGVNGIGNTAGVKKDFNNFAPRFGFAYTVNPKTVLRGGYGINYVPPAFGTSYAFRNPPFASLLTIANTPVTPVGTVTRLSQGLPVPSPANPLDPTGNLSAVAFDMVTPYLHQYNLTAQRELPLNIVATLSYVGVLGRKGTAISLGAGGPNVNQPAPGAGTINPRRPYYSVFPDAGNISDLHNWINSSYQGMQAGVERRFQGGWGLFANYTWSHAIDNAEFRYIAPFVPQQVRGSTNASDGSHDVRQRFALATNWDLPTRNLKGPAGALARNWTANAIAVMETGGALTIVNTSPRSNTGVTDRPDLIGDPVLPSGQRTTARWFNTSAFAPQALYTWGSAGRGILTGPGKVNFDVSLARVLNVSEAVHLQIRMEAFNVTNTPPLGAPNVNFGSSLFGAITSAGPPRNLQAALKLTF
jgi:outer membrane receptor protein involved in Fe transport